MIPVHKWTKFLPIHFIGMSPNSDLGWLGLGDVKTKFMVNILQLNLFNMVKNSVSQMLGYRCSITLQCLGIQSTNFQCIKKQRTGLFYLLTYSTKHADWVKQAGHYLHKDIIFWKKLLENKEMGFKNVKVVKQADSLNKDLRVEKLIY